MSSAAAGETAATIPSRMAPSDFDPLRNAPLARKKAFTDGKSTPGSCVCQRPTGPEAGVPGRLGGRWGAWSADRPWSRRPDLHAVTPEHRARFLLVDRAGVSFRSIISHAEAVADIPHLRACLLEWTVHELARPAPTSFAGARRRRSSSRAVRGEEQENETEHHGGLSVVLDGQAPLGRCWIGGMLELLGGAAILLGALHGGRCLVLSGDAVAIQFHQPNGAWPIQNHGEAAVMLCFIFLFFAAHGAGNWSADALLLRRK